MTALDRIRVGLASPVRSYLRRTPILRGRGFLYFRILPRLLPPAPAGFEASRPDGSRIHVYYREVLGLVCFVTGGFEDAECRLLSSLARGNTLAFDVGANIGIHTIPLARAMPTGTVIAVEPLPANASRLSRNAEANGIGNIQLVDAAAGADEIDTVLQLADDPAYASTTAVHHGRETAGRLTVRQTTLDRIWKQADRPPVSVVKIDIEGGELAALRGATAMLEAERPPLLVETQGAFRSEVVALLATLGYQRASVAGLEPWNILFVHPGHPVGPEVGF